MTRLVGYLRKRFVEPFEMEADAARALRGGAAFAIPLAVCHWLNRPAEALFICTAALNLALPDLRGAYRIRLSILAGLTLVAAASAFLGVRSAGNTVCAVASIGLLAMLSGLWRHLSADYGPAAAVSSALLFLLGLSQPQGWPEAWHLAKLVGLGGLEAAFLHVCYWLVRPQHGLRFAVAETWVAAADLIAAMRPQATPDAHSRSEQVARHERELRGALDRTFLILGAAENRKQAALIAHLEEARREVVHLSMRVIAFNTSLESILGQQGFAGCLPVADSVLKALSDAARSVALTLLMHRAENRAASNVRLKRCEHLIKALDEQIAAVPNGGVVAAQVKAALGQIEGVLPRIHEVLGETREHGGSGWGFTATLPDLSTRSIQSLASWIRPASQIDPVLVRHSLRVAVFTMLAVGLYEGFDIPRGYWIAFTIMVVLQPDYGSTRQRAVARTGGTVAGVVLAGAILWMRLPVVALDALATGTALVFSYFLRRSYGLAIFFITINLVLITETMAPVHKDFMVARVLSTLAGGVLALVAARIFWPTWEGQKFPTLLAGAVRANRVFLESLFVRLGVSPTTQTEPLMAKRRAENANRYLAASVERLLTEPSALRERPERAAALATYNQRVTRALTALTVQLPESGRLNDGGIAEVAKRVDALLEEFARAVEEGRDDLKVAELETEVTSLETELAGGRLLEGDGKGAMPAADTLTRVQLAKTVGELRAMVLGLRMNS